MDNIKRRIELNTQLKTFEAIVDEIKAEMALLDEAIIEDFVQNGTQSIKVDGNTLYIERRLYASLNGSVNSEQRKLAMVMIKQNKELSYLIKESYHAGKLAAAIKEMELDEQGDPAIPDDLKRHINTGFKISIRVRKA